MRKENVLPDPVGATANTLILSINNGIAVV